MCFLNIGCHFKRGRFQKNCISVFLKQVILRADLTEPYYRCEPTQPENSEIDCGFIESIHKT